MSAAFTTLARFLYSARNCFDDKTDFTNYKDGAGVVVTGNNFVDRAGNPLLLFTSGIAAPAMYRTVEVVLNDLNGSIADFGVEQPFLEIHVVVYDGATELVRLRQVFGDY